MLKVKIEDSGSRTDCVIMGSGDIKQLTAEVGMVIQALHSQTKAANPFLAMAFRQGLIYLLTDPKTPVWDPVDSGHGMCVVTPTNSKEEM